MVVSGLDQKNRKMYVGFVAQWDRDQLREIVPKIKKLQQELKWTHIIIDQQSGYGFIRSLRNNGLSVKTISTQKNVNDEKDIDDLEVLDKIEMTQLFLTLKNNHQIIFPENDSVKILEDQVPIFSEHITEAGTVDYYASGEEPDDLIKSLIMCAFSYRKQLTEEVDIIIVGGPISRRTRGHRSRLYGRPDFKNDSDVISALSTGPPGRIMHYY